MATAPVPDPIVFSRTGPFYDMILAFVSALCGLEAFVVPNNPLGYHQGQPGIGLQGKVHTQFILDTYAIWLKHQQKELSLPYVTASLCQMLINTAYETVKDKDDHSPAFEFFRHIRNASSHQGKFFFTAKEPSRAAAWRGLTIDCTIKGNANPLFGTRCFFDLLGPADALLVLWDVEQIM